MYNDGTTSAQKPLWFNQISFMTRLHPLSPQRVEAVCARRALSAHCIRYVLVPPSSRGLYSYKYYCKIIYYTRIIYCTYCRAMEINSHFLATKYNIIYVYCVIIYELYFIISYNLFKNNNKKKKNSDKFKG